MPSRRSVLACLLRVCAWTFSVAGLSLHRLPAVLADTGVSLAQLGRLTGLRPGRSRIGVHGRSRSGEQVLYFDRQDLDKDALLLAYKVNGPEILKKHGYPLRLVTENHMGFQWTNYVFRVDFTS